MSQQSRAQGTIESRLIPNEQLLWSGAPRSGLLLRPADAFLIPFSLLFGGFAIVWEVAIVYSGAPAVMALVGIPFVIAGLYMLIGRFIVDACIRSGTVYGLTNRRAIIVSGLFSKSTHSVPLKTLLDVSMREGSDKSGTILLGPLGQHDWHYWGVRWLSPPATPRFEYIQEAAQVFDCLLQAKREAT